MSLFLAFFIQTSLQGIRPHKLTDYNKISLGRQWCLSQLLVPFLYISFSSARAVYGLIDNFQRKPAIGDEITPVWWSHARLGWWKASLIGALMSSTVSLTWFNWCLKKVLCNSLSRVLWSSSDVIKIESRESGGNVGGQTLLWTLLILAIVHQSAYKLCRFSCTFILFFDVFFVSAVRILLLSNFCKLPLNYMQQEESLDLCSIVRSFFGPIVDFDHNLSSPEFIFVVLVSSTSFSAYWKGWVHSSWSSGRHCFLLGLPLLKRQKWYPQDIAYWKKPSQLYWKSYNLKDIELYPCIRNILELDFLAASGISPCPSKVSKMEILI